MENYNQKNITKLYKNSFKDRLEILPSFKGEKLEYEEIKQNYPEIINLANKYYDLVFVDLDAELGEGLQNKYCKTQIWLLQI